MRALFIVLQQHKDLFMDNEPTPEETEERNPDRGSGENRYGTS